MPESVLKPERVWVSSSWTDQEREELKRVIRDHLHHLSVRFESLSSGSENREERYEVLKETLGARDLLGSVTIHSSHLLQVNRGAFAQFLLEEEEACDEKGPHPSHVTRDSDASTFDEICVNCGATDQVPGGWGQLAEPCPKPVGQGGLTYEQWLVKDHERRKKLEATYGC